MNIPIIDLIMSGILVFAAGFVAGFSLVAVMTYRGKM